MIQRRMKPPTKEEARQRAQLLADALGEPQHVVRDTFNTSFFKILPYGSRKPGGFGFTVWPSR